MSAETPVTPHGPLAVDPALYTLVSQFLAREARLLDEGREEEWYELLADDLRYSVPIRQATAPRSDEITRVAFRQLDKKTDVRLRLDRLNTGHAYSEVPPSRTMRMVGSIEVTEGSDPELIEVTSALLVYRQRGIDPHFDLIPCRRNDVLRRVDGAFQLVSREVILTETSLVTPNLAVIL
jgi:3-phenylpropionate/cinnamic acid dioxygenase small subunit